MTIDSTAIIDAGAKIDSDVTVGSYTVIGPHVTIESGSKIGPHVVINGPTHIGKNNTIFQFASIGEVPQDKKFHGEESKLIIGDGNTIREFVTINRGTEDGGGTTVVGNDTRTIIEIAMILLTSIFLFIFNHSINFIVNISQKLFKVNMSIYYKK